MRRLKRNIVLSCEQFLKNKFIIYLQVFQILILLSNNLQKITKAQAEHKKLILLIVLNIH
jgi:hypothetical protein